MGWKIKSKEMSEIKEEDAADRKRKLDEVLKEGQASKQLHLSALDKFDEVVRTIENDPEWKWPPSCIKCSDLRVQWDDARMEAIQLKILEDLKFGVKDKDAELFDIFDTAKEALAHVAELQRVRNLPVSMGRRLSGFSDPRGREEDVAAIQKLADTFQGLAVTAKMAGDFLQAIAADPEWTWPILTYYRADCSIHFTSNQGRLVEAKMRLDGYSCTVFARHRECYSCSDLAEFCKALKAALQKW